MATPPAGWGASSPRPVGWPPASPGRIIAPELAAEMDQLDEDGQPKAWTEDVYLALDAEGWLDTLAWSPDGRTLAYVAAVDGPSADGYVYDTVPAAGRRLTDGPHQA